MANSKIELASGEVLLDLTGDTVIPDALVRGVSAHGANGEPIVGTLNPVKYVNDIAPDPNGNVALDADDIPADGTRTVSDVLGTLENHNHDGKYSAVEIVRW